MISRESERQIVQEFFEILKTPWEFYTEDRSYDVVLTTLGSAADVQARVVLVFGSETCEFDRSRGLAEGMTRSEGVELVYEGLTLPVYGRAVDFGRHRGCVASFAGTENAGVLEIRDGETVLYRLGFDIFSEMRGILSTGQPAKYAVVPTVEIYRTMVRDLILRGGVPVLEIPPVPGGHDLAVCLTHDVDFVWISRHKRDHTLLGFLYRALVRTPIDYFRGKVGFSKILRNWTAVLNLPLIFAGLARDFWQPFDRYAEIEKDYGGTFYLIPRRDHPGVDLVRERRSERPHPRRATRYDVSEVEEPARELIAKGFEVGLHGIDAWHDVASAREELERIRRVTGIESVGVRMHWLFRTEQTPQVLEEAGAAYDSTMGYNEAIGYRAGTTQVFRPPGARRLLELPMHVQDTALFYRSHLDLGESEARAAVRRLLENSTVHGGVLTVNWHHRSLAPERLWDDFYLGLLEEFEQRGAWFGTARQIVSWFEKRRSVTFDDVRRCGDHFVVRLSSDPVPDLPDLVLRIHWPPEPREAGRLSRGGHAHADISFSGNLDREISKRQESPVSKHHE